MKYEYGKFHKFERENLTLVISHQFTNVFSHQSFPLYSINIYKAFIVECLLLLTVTLCFTPEDLLSFTCVLLYAELSLNGRSPYFCCLALLDKDCLVSRAGASLRDFMKVLLSVLSSALTTVACLEDVVVLLSATVKLLFSRCILSSCMCAEEVILVSLLFSFSTAVGPLLA